MIEKEDGNGLRRMEKCKLRIEKIGGKIMIIRRLRRIDEDVIKMKMRNSKGKRILEGKGLRVEMNCKRVLKRIEDEEGKGKEKEDKIIVRRKKEEGEKREDGIKEEEMDEGKIRKRIEGRRIEKRKKEEDEGEKVGLKIDIEK